MSYHNTLLNPLMTRVYLKATGNTMQLIVIKC